MEGSLGNACPDAWHALVCARWKPWASASPVALQSFITAQLIYAAGLCGPLSCPLLQGQLCDRVPAVVAHLPFANCVTLDKCLLCGDRDRQVPQEAETRGMTWRAAGKVQIAPEKCRGSREKRLALQGGRKQAPWCRWAGPPPETRHQDKREGTRTPAAVLLSRHLWVPTPLSPLETRRPGAGAGD